MKYILITLLSFTFATQITTREFEIEIPVDSPDAYEFSVSVDVLQLVGLDYAQITPISIYGISESYYYGSHIDIAIGDMFCFGQYDYLQCDGGFGILNSSYPNIGIGGVGEIDDVITFKFWAKGPFEDEDTSMGDMNNDGALNVYDVLLLVGIILDGDSGDIFDVMEIIKRV